MSLHSLTDGPWTRTKNVIVTVSLNEDNIFYNKFASNLCGYHDETLNKFETAIQCTQPTSGQFVQLQLNTSNYLNVYEVEVHGT